MNNSTFHPTIRPYRTAHFPRHARIRGKQQGVALIVSLILLVVVTLVAFAAFRGTGLQEKMAGNTFDRAQAFQMAEAALDLASRSVLQPATPLDPSQFTLNGINNCAQAACAENPVNDTNIALANWTLVPHSTTAGAIATVVSLYGNNPSYIVQYMGSCSPTGNGNFLFTNDENNQGGGGSLKTVGQCYRITVRSSTPGANGAPSGDRSQVVLQAIYRTS